jgi:hypothetical protein
MSEAAGAGRGRGSSSLRLGWARRAGVLVCAVALGASPGAAAQPGATGGPGARQVPTGDAPQSRSRTAARWGDGAADLLIAAGDALSAGQHQRAAELAGRVARSAERVARADRAEAWRILGLAQHALGQRDAAAASFYAYLKLEPDAHLDPALARPQVVSFFEEVRAQHAAELASLRPRRRSLWLNFVPLGGQWQNGDRKKLWILGSAGVVLLGANITSYAMLRRWCGSAGQSSTCDQGDPGQPGYVDHSAAARRMQVINIASGVGLLAVYTYSMLDGLHGYARWRSEQLEAPVAIQVSPDGDSLFFTLSREF